MKSHLKRRMKPMLLSAAVLALLAVAWPQSKAQAVPKPTPYPITWELKFDYQSPKRIVLEPRGADGPQAFWYMIYTVKNLNRDEQKFFPVFELMTEEGDVIRSDMMVPAEVYDFIRIREKNRGLATVNELAGVLPVGEDNARDGMIVWKEPNPKMGRFSIFATGLSGESVFLKDDAGKVVEKTDKDGKKSPVVLWKTLRLDYHLPGGDLPGQNKLEYVGQEWVMR